MLNKKELKSDLDKIGHRCGPDDSDCDSFGLWSVAVSGRKGARET
jgi:hypothetical protein